MSDDYADLRPEPLPEVCVARGYVYEQHEAWQYATVCLRCGKEFEPNE